MKASTQGDENHDPTLIDEDDLVTGFPDGPEFWFDKHGRLWFGHRCINKDGPYDREYTLPGAIYRLESREPVTLYPAVSCGLCNLSGHITGGKWVPRNQPD